MYGNSDLVIRGVILELKTVVEGGEWTVAKRLPAVVQASQLCVYGLLVVKGIDPVRADVFPHKAKLAVLLDKALQKSKKVWAEALTKRPGLRHKYLNDVEAIRPSVRSVVKFAEKSFGLYGGGLGSFGVVDVQDTLAGLVGKMSENVELKVGAQTTEPIPSTVQAAIGLGMVAGGLAGRREITEKEISVARIAVRLGSQKDKAGSPESKPVKKLRRTLKKLGKHLPEQRA